jgi:hypothetical protein
MASPSISINPATQTNFAGTFFVNSEGYTQGDALDDPNNRFNLRKGIVSPSASQPMWGGLAINEALAGSGTFAVGGSNNPAGNLQSILTPGTSISAGNSAAITGFTVFNQATAMIQSAQSRVPQAPSGGAINFYRMGSGARVPVQALLAAATAWAGGTVAPAAIYWDTNNLWLTNSSGSGIVELTTLYPNLVIDAINLTNSRVVSYNGTTNFASWVETGACVVLRL